MAQFDSERRWGGAPGRSLTVTRIDISRQSALVEAALFPVPFVLMTLYMVWQALTGKISSVVVVQGSPANFPDWGRWLVLVALIAVISFACWRLANLKRITLIEGRLLVRGLTASVNIPLTQVESIQWTQEPAGDSTLQAMIILRTATSVGRHIRFEPKSAEAFELLRSRLEEPPVEPNGK